MMDVRKIRDIFEAYYEKYKKTEGDCGIWSAYWTIHEPGRSFEINLTRGPEGTRFKIFNDGKKVEEIQDWPAFLDSLDRLETAYPNFRRDDFFGQMAEML